MPDRFGNPTPLEILARITTERDAILDAPGLSPQERRVANMDALGKVIFAGLDPRMVHAKEIEEVLRQSLSAQRGPDESQLDFEIRTGRDAMQRMVNVDPSTAASISEHLTKLEDLRIERKRLQAEDDRAVELHEMEKETHDADMREQRVKDLTEGLLYEVEPGSGKATGFTVYAHDPSYLIGVKEVTDRGNLLLNADQVAGLIDTKIADLKLLNNSSFNAKLSTVEGAHETAITAERLVDAFIEASDQGINTQTYYQKLERAFEGIIEAGDEAFRAMNGGDSLPAVGSEEFNEDRAKAAEWLQGRQLPAGVTESTLVRLAYTWAKSFDNRVTEQDFRNAYSMLAGNSGNPAVVANTIRSATFERQQQLLETVGAFSEDLLRLAPEGSEGHAQGTMLQNAMGRYNTAVGRYDTKSRSLMERWGAKPTGDARRTTPNERRVGGTVFRARSGGQ